MCLGLFFFRFVFIKTLLNLFIYHCSSKLILLVLFFLFTAYNVIAIEEHKLEVKFIINIDSIAIYIKQSKNTSLSTKVRSQSLLRAYKLNKLTEDSIHNKNLEEIIDQAFWINKPFCYKINKERLELSKKNNDSLGIGTSYSFLGYYYYERESLDSSYQSYNTANKIFRELNEDYLSARMLHSMSVIAQDLRDFTGSEKLVFKAIKKYKLLKKNTSLYRCYNTLGINYLELEEFDKALFYHNKAAEYLEKSKYKDAHIGANLNNIGRVYETMGEHLLAVEYFQEALDDYYLRNDDLKNLARLLDNLAYNKFKGGDTLGVYKMLNKALTIRDSLNNISGIVINKLHLAEFHVFRKDTLKAIDYLKDAKILAKSVDNHRDHLASLKMLSKLDKKSDGSYLETYITLNDSLQKQERAIRNKFTRIEYETDEYIEETKRLTTQNILISVIAGIVVIVLALLYFIRRQRAKNKELLFEQEQQRANQEIYDLMQKRQTNLREGRQEERHRISEELHDGILGKLFGTRVGMGYLSLTGDQEDVKEYKSYLDELQGIEKEIRDISHALKNNILKSDNSFVAVIEDYLSNQSKVHGFNYSNKSKKDINWAEIDDKLKVTLYRIVQEAIQNVVKHAAANNVTLVFSKTEKQLHLNVTDDGKGFNSTQGKKGIGLKNMEARILKHYGTLHLDSKEGEGTSITISVAI